VHTHESVFRDKSYLSKENWLELIHASICKQQSRVVVRHYGRRDVVDVLAIIDEKVNEGFSDFCSRPVIVCHGEPYVLDELVSRRGPQSDLTSEVRG
jgi:hypothetical protein